MKRVSVFFVGTIVFLHMLASQAHAQSCSEADFNNDGRVNSADRQLLIDNFFTNNNRYSPASGSFVDADDYNLLAEFYGQTCESSGSDNDNGSDPQPSIDVPNNAIELDPGDNIQSAIDQHGQGVTFYLRRGTYRQQTFEPESRQTFIGERGAVLNGSVRLENARYDSGRRLWYFEDQYENADPHGDCANGYSRCNHEHELFINDQRLKHEDSTGEVSNETWYFDYGANRIYVKNDPRNQKVELSVTPFAILVDNGADDVTIQNLVFEKYATRAQRGAVHFADATRSTGWTIEYNEFRNNHAGGLTIPSDSVIQYNYIHHNGQIGILSNSSNDTRVYRNEIAYNNQAGFHMFWEAGGTKFTFSEDLVIAENYSHHNGGSGIWSDIDVMRTTYDNNLVVYNAKNGIQHEISFDATVKNNFSAYNSVPVDFLDVTWQHGKQIHIQSSSNAEVFDNIVIVDEEYGNGIEVTSDGRGRSLTYDNRPWTAQNNRVYDNTFYVARRRSTYIGLSSSEDEHPFRFTDIDDNTRFYNNTYHVANKDGGWRWDTYMSFDEYRRTGQGSGSRVYDLGSIPQIPSWNYQVGPR